MHSGPKLKRDMPELREVEAYLKWFKLRFPSVLIYKNQNEGRRKPHMAMRMGIIAGIPDLHIIKSVGKWHSYYIEMKLPNGKGVVSVAQKKIISKLISENHAVDVCHGWDEARKKTEDYVNGHYQSQLPSHQLDAFGGKLYGQ